MVSQRHFTETVRSDTEVLLMFSYVFHHLTGDWLRPARMRLLLMVASRPWTWRNEHRRQPATSTMTLNRAQGNGYEYC